MTQIKQIKQSTINRALRLHKKWFAGEGGMRLVVTTKTLKLINFSGADFSRADFIGADFSRADFSGSYFSGADFSLANFSGADFRGEYFIGADFSLANFSGADFSRANFSYADFIRADFSGADFSRADFSGSDFIGADFSLANFSGADFSGADFIGADFRLANFIRADFRLANFSGADFANIYLNYINTINTNGLTVISCQLNTSDENRSIQYWNKLGIVTAGCFSGTLDELKDAVEKKHKNNKTLYAKYQAVFNYIDTVLKLEESSDD